MDSENQTASLYWSNHAPYCTAIYSQSYLCRLISAIAVTPPPRTYDSTMESALVTGFAGGIPDRTHKVTFYPAQSSQIRDPADPRPTNDHALIAMRIAQIYAIPFRQLGDTVLL